MKGYEADLKGKNPNDPYGDEVELVEPVKPEKPVAPVQPPASPTSFYEN